ncbi:MAG: hypothetical protein OQL09_05590, partial [Gammaproteobacteria bacterium]|nr:hypothetical protein [Gammaproteobacteria bacterium]
MSKQLILVIILCLLSLRANAEFMYVQSFKVKVQVEPTFKSMSVFYAKKGDRLQVLENRGRWVLVSNGKKSGWMMKFMLAKHTPVRRVSMLSSNQIIGSVRRRASAVTTAGAARGLTADQRSRIGQKNRANYFDL